MKLNEPEILGIEQLNRKLRALVGCESSGKIREALKARGWDAVSCDLLPTELPGKHHQGDIFDVLYDGWDLLIAHPPCTYLSFAGTKYWNTPGRAEKRLAALSFFNQLFNAPIGSICLENPLGCVDLVIKKHDQIINPYYFGDPHLKRTCLWLKNLPPLEYTLQDDLFSSATATPRPEPIYIDRSGKKRNFVDATGGYHGEGNSFKKRSVTFDGIAQAMADQWTKYFNAA